MNKTEPEVVKELAKLLHEFLDWGNKLPLKLEWKSQSYPYDLHLRIDSILREHDL